VGIINVDLIGETQQRYLTYALSVVNSRALPDVRDGLKPVQRRILYAMHNNLHLNPDKPHRKSAAVVGEVLARFHPHGDSACYEALVRMAQPFNFRYPLVDGQGNFGSLDGDGAAAYRYTEARLMPIALEVIGDIGQETVAERDNFDQTVKEPVVLPTRVPNLLINGSSGIAVGMATNIPPHNITEVVKALILLLEEEDASEAKILGIIKGPDFPTGCSILNSKKELKEIYATGRGAIRMRADYRVESEARGKQSIIITSIPYAVDKSSIVEKIADLIIAKKLPQILDVRDESTDVVRVVLELAAGADAEKAMIFLFKHTPLQTNFNVNLVALVPTENPLSGKPLTLSLREVLCHFVDFRLDVTKAKLSFEKMKLEQRIHLLEGLKIILDSIPEVITIVRKSSGRADAAEKLQNRFKLSEAQAHFIVDLRIYQLSKTNIDEIISELDEKLARVAEIERLLKSTKALKKEIIKDLERILEAFGDKRRSSVVNEYEEVEVNADDFIQDEQVKVVVTKDGWVKRIKQTNELDSTRIREGDKLFFSAECSTKSTIFFFSNFGNFFATKVFELPATSGFGDPVQKLFKFKDGEKITSVMVSSSESDKTGEIFVFTKKGLGFRIAKDILGETKKNGKRYARPSKNDEVLGVIDFEKKKKQVLLVSRDGYGVTFLSSEIPVLTGAGKGVILQRETKDDELAVACFVSDKAKVDVQVDKGGVRTVEVNEMELVSRGKRGVKVVKRGTPVELLLEVKEK
jgi:DNA gyrase subunit A